MEQQKRGCPKVALSRFARSRVWHEQKELFEDERTQSIVGTKKAAAILHADGRPGSVRAAGLRG